MNLPTHIADKIQTFVANTDIEGAHTDNEAARYGGISLMGSLGMTWLMRPDGSMWDVNDDFGRPLQLLGEHCHVMALALGAERHAWLAELLPPRPPNATDCAFCQGRKKLATIYRLNDGQKVEGEVVCDRCSALGWTVTST